MSMKKELHKDYVSLCHINPAEEGNFEFLFGDIAKATKDITEANKLTKRFDLHQLSVEMVTQAAQGVIVATLTKAVAASSCVAEVKVALF